MEAIGNKSEKDFIKMVGDYARVSPFDHVKNQLMTRIKEVHLPEESAGALIAKDLSQLNFLDDDEASKPKKKQVQKEDSDEEAEKKEEKKSGGHGLDFS